MNPVDFKSKNFTDVDMVHISTCLSLLESVAPPIYSHFRAVALISYLDLNGSSGYVVGTNAESVFIGGSICAERSCVNKLREIRFEKIVKIYLVSDDEEFITPGDLCREFLLDQMPADTEVIMWGKNSFRISTLIALYPYPPLYRGIDSSQLEIYAKSFSEKSIKLDSGDRFFLLYKKTVEATVGDENDQYSPIKLAAGVEFEDGTIEVIWQDKMIEYGTTTDPIARLVVLLQLYRRKSIEPLCIIQADQYGVMHAPFAAGRANLYENEFKNVPIIINDSNGNLKYTNSLELSPEKLK